MRTLSPVEAQWIFTELALQHTPSRDDGISLEDQLARRKTAVGYMRSLALRCKICDPKDPVHLQARGVLTVGATLLHRFYMRRSMADFKDPYIAATMLFLASKIEEEPLKLRHIVNTCLSKWEQNALPWDPHSDKGLQQPSPEYMRWERNILATEEIVLEALCFDTTVEQPYIVLRRSIRGLNELLPFEGSAESSRTAEARASANASVSSAENGKGKGKLSERVILDLSWTLMNEAHVTPLPVLHDSHIFAFAIFVLSLAWIEQIILSDAYAAASEIGSRFDLDMQFSESDGAEGADLADVKLCIKQFLGYCRQGHIDKHLLDLLVTEPKERPPGPYCRRFSIASTSVQTSVQDQSPQPEKKQNGDTGRSQKQSVAQHETTSGVLNQDEPMGEEELFGEEPAATAVETYASSQVDALSPPRY